MKTINEINREIKEKQEILLSNQYTTRNKNRAKDKICVMNLAKQYLSTNPTEDFIQQESDRILNRLNNLEAFFVRQYPKFDKKIDKELRETFDRTHDIKKLRQQLLFLKYLLS